MPGAASRSIRQDRAVLQHQRRERGPRQPTIPKREITDGADEATVADAGEPHLDASRPLRPTRNDLERSDVEKRRAGHTCWLVDPVGSKLPETLPGRAGDDVRENDEPMVRVPVDRARRMLALRPMEDAQSLSGRHRMVNAEASPVVELVR